MKFGYSIKGRPLNEYLLYISYFKQYQQLCLYSYNIINCNNELNEKKNFLQQSALVFIVTKTWKLFKKTVNFKSKKCSAFVYKFLSVVKEIEKILIVGSRYFATRRLKECKEIRNEIISDSRDSNWNYLDQSKGKQFKRQPNQIVCAKTKKERKL